MARAGREVPGGCGRLLALGLIALAIPAERFGASPQYRIGEEQARAAADTFLRSRGIDPSAFRHVTFPDTHWGGDDSLAGKYFLEHGSVSTAAALFETEPARAALGHPVLQVAR